jgi:hypothetical protein
VDLGLCMSRRGDGALARRLNCRWAHAVCDLTDGVPDMGALLEDMLTHGMRPVLDCRTTIEALGKMLYQSDDAIADRAAAIGWFTGRILELLDRYLHLRDIEIWASAEMARFQHGGGITLDYSTILQDVYATVTQERPDVRVWTGGFGPNCQIDFLQQGIARYAPTGFDVLNMHPFLSSTGTLEVDLQTCAMRLEAARKIVDEQCARQPFASTGFGIPTVASAPPPAYGRFWRLPDGVRALTEAQAGAWYTGFLELFEQAGFRCCCLMVRDRPEHRYMCDFAGLLHADGTPKAFLDDLMAWSDKRAETPAG